MNLTASRTPPPGKTRGIGAGISFPPASHALSDAGVACVASGYPLPLIAPGRCSKRPRTFA